MNVTNLACGIGRSCDVGQLCSGAQAPAWYILVATQNWNDLMNSIYTSIAFADSSCNGHRSEPTTKRHNNQNCHVKLPLSTSSLALIGVLASSTGIVPGWVFPGCGIWVYLTIQGFLYTTVSEIGLWQNTMRDPPDVISGYTKWADFSWTLSMMQDRTQQMIANYTLGVLQAGISTQKGMYGALQNGAFLEAPLSPPESEALNAYERVVTLRLLSAVLKSQSQTDEICRVFLSFEEVIPVIIQDLTGLLMVHQFCLTATIPELQADGTKTIKKFFGSSKIATKYGFTPEFLTTAAWNCQKKYGKYEYDPYAEAGLPLDINTECIFNLPVCDCTEQVVKEARERGVRTAKACQDAGVPIYAPKSHPR
ncbi:uncharacterized protein MELLADRAFT_104118 [Melampsora larici-populina 98AG31]|uniref:DUF7872 domain-containing protein n=1 Tax=Melampsora larici-populina (strain 98AG31 / pathotype 3-4-7) TaxID=747676 RepID=F4RDM3_MELLP|nr:uncharacterized protein MELLADRAFT_104118 [Melampsora larici-populina 98AG31]EGG09582.1 hypothetical protein MELLADRAFT_104118 [Melampsora larici-populina 98AG31]